MCVLGSLTAYVCWINMSILIVQESSNCYVNFAGYTRFTLLLLHGEGRLKIEQARISPCHKSNMGVLLRYTNCLTALYNRHQKSTSSK